MTAQHLSEQQIIRREKLIELQKMGIDAYPASLYPVNTTSVYIKENYKGDENKNDFARRRNSLTCTEVSPVLVVNT